MKTNTLINLIALLISINTYAQTYTYKCGDNENAMSPVVEAKVSFDKKTGLYTYKYKIKNKSDALVPIERFHLVTFTNVADIKSYENWKFLSFEDNDLFWSSKSEGSHINATFKNGVLDFPPGNVYDVFPGKSIDGFEFKSPHPPGPVKIRFSGTPLNNPDILGSDGKPIENLKELLSENEILEFTRTSEINCPGYFDSDLDVDNPRDSGLIEVTTGPIPPTRVTAKLRLRKIKEKKWRGSYETEHEIQILPIDAGKIQVMLFGSRELDVTKIDLTSLTFGQGKAKPLKAVILNDFKDNDGDVDDDIKKHIKKNNVRHLLMEFNLDAVDIRCDADRALFLNGKIGIKDLFGAVRIKHGLCSDKKNNAKEVKKKKDNDAKWKRGG